MAKRRHKNDTKTFGEETFAEQARTLNATVNNLYNAIEHHVDHSPRRTQTKQKCIRQIQNLLNKVNAIP